MFSEVILSKTIAFILFNLILCPFKPPYLEGAKCIKAVAGKGLQQPNKQIWQEPSLLQSQEKGFSLFWPMGFLKLNCFFLIFVIIFDCHITVFSVLKYSLENDKCYLWILFFFPIQDKLSLEGIVVQRAECRPAASENYMRLKRLVFCNSRMIPDISLWGLRYVCYIAYWLH